MLAAADRRAVRDQLRAGYPARAAALLRLLNTQGDNARCADVRWMALPSRSRNTKAASPACRRRWQRRGIDVLMINHLENIYYLSGFRTIGYYSFMALFVPASGQPVHLTRLIEKTTLQGTSWIADRELYPDTENYLDACVRVINARGWGGVAHRHRQERPGTSPSTTTRSSTSRLPKATLRRRLDDRREPAADQIARRAGLQPQGGQGRLGRHALCASPRCAPASPRTT